jgi:hypothetical protein
MYNNTSQDIQSNLNYKDQREFFDKFYPLREEANNALANILITDPPEFNLFFLKMTEFVNWASKGYSTLNTKDDKNHFIKVIKGLIKEWIEGRDEIEYHDSSFDKFYDKCQDLWDDVGEQHIKFELLPRPEIEIFDKSAILEQMDLEKHENMKLALKAFNDIMRNTIIKKERK